MWEMDYESAANYWTIKDKGSVQMPEDELRKRIEEFIKANRTCALATASDEMVRCTPIEYNYVNHCFYLFSEDGLKFKGLKENKNVGLAIYASYEGFGKLKGLQIVGKAEIIEPFSEEYNKVCEFRKIPIDVMKKLPKPINLIKVNPENYDYLDSDLKQDGFGSRQHLEG